MLILLLISKLDQKRCLLDIFERITAIQVYENSSKKNTSIFETDLQTKKAWDQFKGGFFVGACGSAGFALICLSSIPKLLSFTV